MTIKKYRYKTEEERKQIIFWLDALYGYMWRTGCGNLTDDKQNKTLTLKLLNR